MGFPPVARLAQNARSLVAVSTTLENRDYSVRQEKFSTAVKPEHRRLSGTRSMICARPAVQKTVASAVFSGSR